MNHVSFIRPTLCALVVTLAGTLGAAAAAAEPMVTSPSATDPSCIRSSPEAHHVWKGAHKRRATVPGGSSICNHGTAAAAMDGSSRFVLNGSLKRRVAVRSGSAAS